MRKFGLDRRKEDFLQDDTFGFLNLFPVLTHRG